MCNFSAQARRAHKQQLGGQFRWLCLQALLPLRLVAMLSTNIDFGYVWTIFLPIFIAYLRALAMIIAVYLIQHTIYFDVDCVEIMCSLIWILRFEQLWHNTCHWIVKLKWTTTCRKRYDSGMSISMLMNLLRDLSEARIQVNMDKTFVQKIIMHMNSRFCHQYMHIAKQIKWGKKTIIIWWQL